MQWFFVWKRKKYPTQHMNKNNVFLNSKRLCCVVRFPLARYTIDRMLQHRKCAYTISNQSTWKILLFCRTIVFVLHITAARTRTLIIFRWLSCMLNREQILSQPYNHHTSLPTHYDDFSVWKVLFQALHVNSILLKSKNYSNNLLPLHLGSLQRTQLFFSSLAQFLCGYFDL